jgi:hypothetical protein
MTALEAARIRGVSLTSIYTAVKFGALQAERDGDGHLHISDAALATYWPRKPRGGQHVERDAKICDLRARSGLTMTQLSQRFGLDRQRVRQIIRAGERPMAAGGAA